MKRLFEKSANSVLLLLFGLTVGSFAYVPAFSQGQELVWLVVLIVLNGGLLWHAWRHTQFNATINGRFWLPFGVLYSCALIGSRHLFVSLLGVPGRTDTALIALLGLIGLFIFVQCAAFSIGQKQQIRRGLAGLSSIVLCVGLVGSVVIPNFISAWLPLHAGNTLLFIGGLGLILWFLDVSAGMRFVCVHTLLFGGVVWIAGSTFMVTMALALSLLLLAWSLEKLGRLRVVMAAVLMLIALTLLLIPTFRLQRLPVDVLPSTSATLHTAFHEDRSMHRILLGEGPGAFSVAYAAYKPASVNQTPFWDIRFDTGSSQLLTWLVELGLLSVLGIVMLFGSLLFRARRVAGKDEFMTPTTLLVLFAGMTLVAMPVTLLMEMWLVVCVALYWEGGSRQHVSRTVSKMWPYIALVLLIIGGLTVVQNAIGMQLDARSRRAYARGDIRRAYARSQLAAQIVPQRSDLQRTVAVRGVQFLQQLSADALEERPQEVTELLTSIFAASDRSVALHDDSVAVWRGRAEVYDAVGLFVGGAELRAIEAYTQAITREPLNPALRLARVDLLLRLLPQQEVLEIEEGVRMQWHAWIEEDLLFVRTNRLTRDVAYYDARWLDAQGNTNESIQIMEALVSAHPNDALLALDLALLHLRERDTIRAEQVLQTLLEHVPGVADAHWYLAAIYEDTGRLALARQHIELLVQRNSEDLRARDKLRQLQLQEDNL